MHPTDPMLQRLFENDEIQRKFHQLEVEIISVLDFKDFFEKLLTETMIIFQIPYVWISVIRESHLADLMNRLSDSDIIRKRTNFIDRSDFKKIFSHHSAPLLRNENLDAFAAFFPDNMVCPMGSLSIAPLAIDGEIVGSLNQWDALPSRFEPDMDTSFLEQLTLKISLCLSNVAAHEKLRFFAYHDPLTGLFNRRAFEEALHREFSRSRRHGSDLSLVFLDLDGFKQVNDTYGHDIGDLALKQLAAALSTQSRKEDIAARLAGDEFVVILSETGEDTAGSLMDRVQEYLDGHPIKQADRTLSISFSYGVASTADPHILTPDHLLKKADDRLYAVKKKRKIKVLADTQYFYASKLAGIHS